MKIGDQDSSDVGGMRVGVDFGDFPIDLYEANNKVVHHYAPRMVVECVRVYLYLYCGDQMGKDGSRFIVDAFIVGLWTQFMRQLWGSNRVALDCGGNVGMLPHRFG